MENINVFIDAINKPHLPRTYCAVTKKNAYTKTKCTCGQANCQCKNTSSNFYPCGEQGNILTKPADLEETCVVFNMTELSFGISSRDLLSLKNLVTEVIYPFTCNYDFYRLNYNHRFDYYPVAIVRAHVIRDVVNTIKFCRKFNLPIRTRSGAHCYQPASLVNFGIVLDQRPRDKIIKINYRGHEAKIEAGALLGPVINKLAQENITIPFGTCCTNGMAGLALGGGIGFTLREYGLTSDNVVNMTVVLADGQVVCANSQQNTDLFWALRGAGGGNFGVVTDFTFRTAMAKWVTIFTMNFKFSDAKAVYKVWQNWSPYTNTKLTSEFDFFNQFQPIIVTGQLLPGDDPSMDKKLLFELIKPLIDLNLHTSLSIKTMTLQEAGQYYAQGSYARPLYFYNKSDFIFDPLPDEAIDIIICYMSLLKEENSFHKTEINALGGNFAKIPSNATAFPSRSAIQWIQYTSLWDTGDQEEKNVCWLRQYYAALRPYFLENMRYVNALDYDIPRCVALKAYYGCNLPELIKIKQKYDPTNFFNFEQSIVNLNDLE